MLLRSHLLQSSLRLPLIYTKLTSNLHQSITWVTYLIFFLNDTCMAKLYHKLNNKYSHNCYVTERRVATTSGLIVVTVVVFVGGN